MKLEAISKIIGGNLNVLPGETFEVKDEGEAARLVLLGAAKPAAAEQVVAKKQKKDAQ